MQYSIQFPSGKVSFQFGVFQDLREYEGPRRVIFITDTNVFSIYRSVLADTPTIVIPAGEASKSWHTVQSIADQLISLEADRNTLLVGLGGGVVTDITGFIASVYLRGVSFAFVPTTLLAMVDASVGGKNGINHGMYKNMLGNFRHPEAILFDIGFLDTLPDSEWSNGFAEIIKYGCIFDVFLFEELLEYSAAHYIGNPEKLTRLIDKCLQWKIKAVKEDEQERGHRKLLNFGHTVGHAIENQYGLSHGYAISIGMVLAATISERLTSLPDYSTPMLKRLLQQYDLPVSYPFDPNQVMSVLRMDKKRHTSEEVNFILLERLGTAVIRSISFDDIAKALNNFRNAGDH